MISNKYQKVIVIGLIIFNVSYFTLALDNILYTMYFPSILTILVSYFIMISNKSKKVFGIGFATKQFFQKKNLILYQKRNNIFHFTKKANQ